MIDSLKEIAERACTLPQRLAGRHLSEAFQFEPDQTGARLEQWKKNAAGGHQAKFEEYLGWNGLDIASVNEILGPVKFEAGTVLPGWAVTLGAVLETAAQTHLDEAWPRYFDSELPVPFQEILIPFIEVARHKLETRLGERYQLLAEQAHASLERYLLLTLSRLSCQALMTDFKVFCATRQISTLFFSPPPVEGNFSRKLYLRFVKGMLEGNLLTFFREYSVLGRLMATALEQWLCSVGEFGERLAADWQEIEQVFASGQKLEQVSMAEAGLSDNHNDGRTVFKLQFSSSLKLIYKPKPLGLEREYNQLLRWLNARGAPLPLKTFEVLPKSNYGWVEFVEAAACQDRGAVQRYYRRMGMLLSLMHLLDGTDCHYENLIASGEHPVLIDTETLLHPKVPFLPAPGEKGRFMAIMELIENSVLRTAILPVSSGEADQADYSALAAVTEQESTYHLPRWQNVNTDSMLLTFEKIAITPSHNVPKLEGSTIEPGAYLEELVDGFRQMYHFLLEVRSPLLAPEGPLACLAGQKVRFLFRNSKVYGLLLNNLLQPKFLREGIDRSLQLESLGKAFILYDTRPDFWPLLQAEREVMEQMDIPLFSTTASSTTLPLPPGEIITNWITTSSYELVLNRLRHMNKAAIEAQIEIIRGSVYAHTSNQKTAPAISASSAGPLIEPDTTRPLTPAEMLEEALNIAREINRRAIWSQDGSATWLGLFTAPGSSRCQFRPMEHGFYSGHCGTAFFLAALEKVAAPAGFRKLALAALASLRQDLHSQDAGNLLALYRSGGWDGWGLMVYALVTISRWLNEPGLIADARLISSLFTPEKPEPEASPVALADAAGAILGLLALYHSTSESQYLVQASGWAEMVLAGLDSGLFQPSAQVGTLPEISADHILAVRAFIQLYDTTRQERFRLAAHKLTLAALTIPFGEHESLESLIQANPSYLATLTRLALIYPEGFDNSQLRSLLETVSKAGLPDEAWLWNGEFGWSGLFMDASARLDLPELAQVARQKAAGLVRRARKNGGYRLFSNLPAQAYSPALFRGAAGIGYQLVGLSYPEIKSWPG
jgi:type 2 lantibiotic biosynthesis protein LanM